MKTVNFENASPEVLNLFDIAKSIVAYNSITPMHYQGLIAGSEFLTYDVKKIYIALRFTAMGVNNAGVVLPRVDFFDNANAMMLKGSLHLSYYNAAEKFTLVDYNCNLIWFARITSDVHTQIIFNGYKLVAP